MKKIMFAAIAALSLVGCGGDLCSGSSKCSADPTPTDAEIQACKDAIKDGAKCATEYKNLAQCSKDNQVCGSDNKTDGTATAAKCSTQVSAYSTCLTM